MENSKSKKENQSSNESATAADKKTKDQSPKTEQKEENEEMNTTKQKTAQTQSENVTPAEAVVETPSDSLSEAKHIVKNRTIASVGAGLIPFPAVDIAALTGIQIDTVRALSKLYDVKFTKDLGKTAITSLTGGVFPVSTGPWVSSAVKTVPFVGQIMGSISMPVIAGATTYALGQIFIQHFESGGTFLTFDPEKVKDHFQEEFEKGKEFAKKEADAKTS